MILWRCGHITTIHIKMFQKKFVKELTSSSCDARLESQPNNELMGETKCCNLEFSISLIMQLEKDSLVSINYISSHYSKMRELQ